MITFLAAARFVRGASGVQGVLPLRNNNALNYPGSVVPTMPGN
jgi:hypothetical protein